MTTAVREAPNHNKLTCYTDYRCRLPECVERYREWDRARYRAQANGEPGRYVDAEPVRQHLLQLYSSGVTIHRIAATTGLTYLAIRSFTHHEYGNRRPRRRRCMPETAAKILAVTRGDITTGRIDSTGTIRRLHALVAIGWPLERIGPYAGLSAENLNNLTRRGKVLASTADGVAKAYELLSRQKPARHGVDKRNISRARNRAKANRWPPPKYWADLMDVIDDPHFEPMYGVTRGELLAADGRELLALGVHIDQAAARLGVTRNHLQQEMLRHPETNTAAAMEVAA